MKPNFSFSHALFFIGCFLFAISNILNIRDSDPFQIVLLLSALFVILRLGFYQPLVLLPFVLAMKIKFMLIFGFLFFLVGWMRLILKSCSGRLLSVEFFYLIFSVFGFFVAVSVGGDFKYNLARYLAMFGPLGFFCFSGVAALKSDGLDSKFGLVLVFVLSVVLSIACKILYFWNFRISIFEGTENVAFVLITILLVSAGYFVDSRKGKVFLVVLYVVYIAFTSSRTAFALSLIPSFYVIFGGGQVVRGLLFCSVCLLCVISVFYGYLIETKIGNDIFVFVNNFDGSSFLDALAVVDIRGSLYREAISLIGESPWFGHGSITPSYFYIGSDTIQDFHNSVLDILVAYGVVGLTCFLLALLAVFWSLRRIFDKTCYFMFFVFSVISLVQPIVFNLQATFVLYMTATVILMRQANLIISNKELFR